MRVAAALLTAIVGTRATCRLKNDTVTLPDCSGRGCDAAGSVLSGGDEQPDSEGLCSARDTCAAPFFAAFPDVGTINVYCGPVGCSMPPVGSGSPMGACATAQETTGLRCCDDPTGDLAAVGTDCDQLASDVTRYCYEDVNTRLRAMGLCHVDPLEGVGGAGRRTVRQLCPKRCQNMQVAGCECPKAYDKGCPDLQCLVPDEDNFDFKPTCSDCSVDGAQLKCSKGDSIGVVLTVMMSIVLAALFLGVVGYVAKSKNAVQAETRRTASVDERMQARIAPTQVQLAGAKGLLEAYRVRFERLCYNFGWFLASHRQVFLVVVLTLMITFSVCGLPQAEIDKSPTSEEWAPEGSMIARQLQFYNKWTPPSGVYPTFVLMVGSNSDAEDAMKRKYVRDFHRTVERLRRVTVSVRRTDGNGSAELGWEDYCSRPAENPVYDSIHPGVKPCVNPSILDCFYEGAWQIQDVSSGVWPDTLNEQMGNLERAVVVFNMIFGGTSDVVDNYRGRPSYQNLTDAEVHKILSEWKVERGGCQHWALGFKLKQMFALGGVQTSEPLQCPLETSQEAEVVSARMLTGLFYANNADRLKLGKRSLDQFQVEDLRSGYDKLVERIVDEADRIDSDESEFPGTRVSIVTSDFYKDVMKELSSAQFVFIITGYALMMTVILWEVNLHDPMENLAPVAAVYFIFIVVLSTCAAYGFIAAAGIKYSHLMLQVLPYLSIGLGVDDMFLFLHYFREVPNKRGHKSAEVVADLVHSAGRSVSLTSLTNFITFFGGTVVTIPALRNYLILAGLIVLFNYVSSVMCLPLMLSWWVDRNRESRPDVEAPAGVAGTKKSGFQGIMENSFAPFMHKKPVQGALVGTWAFLLLLFTITLNTSHPITVDFSIKDLAPKGSYLSQSVSDFQDHVYPQYYHHEWLVEVDGTGGSDGVDIADPAVQQALQSVNARLGYSPEMNNPGFTHWLRRFFEFVQKKAPEAVHKTNYHTGESVETDCDPGCLGSANRSFCEAQGACGLYKLGHGWWVDREVFWPMLHTWRHPILGGIDSLNAEAQAAGAWAYRFGPDRYNPQPGCTEVGCNDTNYLRMMFTRFQVDSRCQKSPGEWKDHTKSFREMINRDLGEHAYPKPTDKYYDVELYESTLSFFWTTLAIGVCGVLVSGFIVPVSPKGAVIIALSGLAGAIELTGMLMLAGISFTTTIAVSVIMSIGLSVDPVVHAVSAYEHSNGRRLHNCIRFSTIPIMKSNVSTMISFVMMAFSKFPYVVKYSFLPLFLSVCISLVHGTLFVPALLGLIGSDNVNEAEEAAEATKVQVGSPVVEESGKVTTQETAAEANDSLG
eukprot:TRINITY_DN4826_c0_g1_i1.p1 TRINITY_DN4826_c0_g1~~TRINITY_DN4826_c0_g1_i1.p1  ORF type:complete len:1328 (+),score=349.62 TRINITY_DN4826_c0_g1_i1:71-4054(+)